MKQNTIKLTAAQHQQYVDEIANHIVVIDRSQLSNEQKRIITNNAELGIRTRFYRLPKTKRLKRKFGKHAFLVDAMKKEKYTMSAFASMGAVVATKEKVKVISFDVNKISDEELDKCNAHEVAHHFQVANLFAYKKAKFLLKQIIMPDSKCFRRYKEMWGNCNDESIWDEIAADALGEISRENVNIKEANGYKQKNFDAINDRCSSLLYKKAHGKSILREQFQDFCDNLRDEFTANVISYVSLFQR